MYDPMNSGSNNKYLFWLLIFLVVVNISMFITLVILFSNNKETSNPPSGEQLKNSFSNSLSLSPVQDKKVKVILDEYKILTDPIVADIRNHRMQILEEAAKDQPDKTILDRYAKIDFSNSNEVIKGLANKIHNAEKISADYKEFWRENINSTNPEKKTVAEGIEKLYKLPELKLENVDYFYNIKLN
jgi:predicted permease